MACIDWLRTFGGRPLRFGVLCSCGSDDMGTRPRCRGTWIGPPRSVLRFRPLFRGYTTILPLSLLGALGEYKGVPTVLVMVPTASVDPDEDTPSMTTVGVSALSPRPTGSCAWSSVVGAMVTMVVCPPLTTSPEEVRQASSKGCGSAPPANVPVGVGSAVYQKVGVARSND